MVMINIARSTYNVKWKMSIGCAQKRDIRFVGLELYVLNTENNVASIV